MNRKHAIAAGAKLYDPDRPCSRGHVAQRYVRSGACLACLAENKTAKVTRLSLLCHPDDAAVLTAVHRHLALMRGSTP